ncbi:MAG: type II secretion system protein GspD, partial [Alphaproteobacteria bacterium]|nr:type II secretion system protein GspD [Alphaproteobacteria bacterium]
DVDMLAGQSYALFPVVSGGVKDFAAALQDAFRGQQGSAEGPRTGNLASFVRVVPMERINAVLVVSAQPRYIEEARRVYAVVDRARRQTVRSWHVTYLRNSDVNDIAYTLQSALTPNNITVQPRAQAASPFTSGQTGAQHGGVGQQGTGGGGLGQGIGGGTAAGGVSAQPLGGTPGTQTAQQQQPGQQQAPNPNPLLGGLDPLGGAGNAVPDALRIVPNEQNSALLIYGTAQEQDLIAAMLRKIDVLPRQVRIDATIAEVTLNDQLQYGTQFFFRSGGLNGALSYANAAVTDPQQPTFASQFPGFFLGGRGLGGAPIALNALQSVTSVNVLSSPQLMVVDNQVARLQVGNMVPYLSQTSQSTVSAGAPVINSINYQQTGVIMQIRPRINSGGLVTLDISQEVSDVNTDPSIATAGITSPTFLERSVSSRVVVQDGQTIGLAGLIRDNSSRGNEGLPWLKDIPLLGLLAGKQDNTRARTELLILITPHVIEDHRDARALTEDMREQLGAAAAVPDILRRQRASGSNDPGAPLRKLPARATP